MGGGRQMKKYRLPKDCFVRQWGRGVQVVNHRTRRIVRIIRPPASWGDAWVWNTTEGGFYLRRLGPRAAQKKLAAYGLCEWATLKECRDSSPAARRLRRFEPAVRRMAESARKRADKTIYKAIKGEA